MSFHCTVVTPEEQTLDLSVQQVILPAHDGLLGILTGRSPLLVKLGTGPLRVDVDSRTQRYYFIDGGVAQMRGGKLTILTTEAIPASELDAQTAQAEYAAAAARKTADEATGQARQHDMDRARAKKQVALKQ